MEVIKNVSLDAVAVLDSVEASRSNQIKLNGCSKILHLKMRAQIYPAADHQIKLLLMLLKEWLIKANFRV